MALSTTQYGYIIDPMVPFTDGKGNTIKDGFVRVFVAGSSTPVITYRNFDGAANQDLIELDNSGRTKTSVIGSKGLTYKVCVYDQLHSQESPILTVEKVSVIGANITAGSGATVVTGLDGLTTKPKGFVDASVVGTDGYVALDHTLVEDDLDTDVKVTAVENDRYIPLLNDDVNDPDSKMTLGRLWQWVLGKIKSLSTTITAFRTGDYVAVDGPDGTAKMSKDTLLKETAQNALAGNVALAFEPTRTSENPYKAGEVVAYEGKTYTFKVDHYGAWDADDVEKARNVLGSVPLVESTDIANLVISDKFGNMALVISEGQIITKFFNSKKTPTFEEDVADFAVSDGNGKRCLVVYDGHLITKKFDSRTLQAFYKTSKNYGKSVGVFGGSLSVYPESQAAKRLWKKFLNFNITDYGVGGAGFSSLQGSTPIQTQVDNATSKDIYILWASTNDYTHSREIGSYSDYTYLDNYDSSKLTTQCGGINYCIKKLYEKNPFADIYFFTGIDFFSQEGGYNPFTEQTNSLGYTYQQYVDAQKKCCELFSIPVLDQNAISGLNIFNFTNFFKSDNLHMKEVGYEKIAMQQVQFLANGL